ncbi:MAG: DNA-3-methyladenine glycosylase [Candidatus Cardinium sp.]|uniref:DNA-3-methyladenine glycosylase n=1 Tax=Cardinium endosymbiont of Dermatophagoides farinae TaxID=2597823 RepID=UPI00118356A3|nr:DNA-3-methyladenine glycosylase [Cardinium endosymbiont of Dermatophagoides farinae]TSJ80870.1 DNA-3-methyladenine glycosylase [Cardinium endosymbiont of Dermatophagoides farinae]UWW96878.1 MAG: DNA-3-methyladenine glycosylase [Candidatus Cardinium sp.]
MILNRAFFAQDTNTVSIHLIGKLLCFHNFQGIITETESYIGADDPACHAAKGMTKRTKVMFGSAGFSYVYFIYGRYYCLNIVTEALNFPAATLIRGIQLIHPPYTYLDGPGKLCQFLGINVAHNAINVTESNALYIKDIGCALAYTSTPRIGISKGLDKMWRYVVTDKSCITAILPKIADIASLE